MYSFIAPVSIFGEAEFIFSIVKLTTMIGLLILSLVIDLGGARREPACKAPSGTGSDVFIHRAGNHPVAEPQAVLGFAGWFATVIAAGFAFGGSEGIIAAAGEAKDPRKPLECSYVGLWLRQQRR
jgi:amino acid transporter